MPKRKRDPLSRVKPITRPHVTVHDTQSWTLYHIPGNQWPWYQLKLVRKLKDSNPRASYWLSWSVEDRRFARGHDCKHLEEHSPHLYAWLVEWLAGNLLPKVRGLTVRRVARPQH